MLVIAAIVSRASKENPAGNESGRQEIDDLLHLGSQKLTMTSRNWTKVGTYMPVL